MEQETQDFMVGQLLACYHCPNEAKIEAKLGGRTTTVAAVEAAAPLRKVVRLGRVVNHVDPTQTYELECGHVTI
jgi:hypothetical protein